MREILNTIINFLYKGFLYLRLTLALVGIVAIIDISTTVYSNDIANKIESYGDEYFTLGEVFDSIDFDYVVMAKRYGAESTPLYVSSIETGQKYNISDLGTRNAIFVFFKGGEAVEFFEMSEEDLFVEGNGASYEYDIIIYKDELLYKFYVDNLNEINLNVVTSFESHMVIGKVENMNTEDKDYLKVQEDD